MSEISNANKLPLGILSRRRKATSEKNFGGRMIFYEPDSIIKDFGIQGKLFFKYIKLVQFENSIEVVQLKSDEYIKEVKRRYERRYSIKNIILRKIKDILK